MKSLSLAQPHAIIMVGIPGSGKTLFAEKFANTFHAPYSSLDAIDQIVDDQTKSERLQMVHLRELAQTGSSIVVDTITDTRSKRTALHKLFSEHGYQSLFVWVQTDTDTARRRSSKNKSMSSSEFEEAVKRFSPPHNSEKPLVLSGKHTYASQARIILKRLSAPRAEISSHNKSPVRGSNQIVVR